MIKNSHFLTPNTNSIKPHFVANIEKNFSKKLISKNGVKNINLRDFNKGWEYVSIHAQA